MTIPKLSRSVTLAVGMGVSALGLTSGGAFAQATTAISEAPYQTQHRMLKTAGEAGNAVAQVRAARVALFDGDVPYAKASVEAARESLLSAESDFAGLMMRDFTDVDSDTNFLPFDMSMSLTEDFTDTDANKDVVKKAIDLFTAENADAAVTTLNAADIEVQVETAMLPYEATIASLDGALGDIEDGNYYTANLDLKAINDSVIVRSFTIDAIPQQGAAG